MLGNIYPLYNTDRDFLKQVIKDTNTNEPLNGEIDMYLELYKLVKNSKESYHVWFDLYLPYHVDGKTIDGDQINPKKKTSTQIDFLILCNKGVIILEVKGGSVYTENRKWYYANGNECQNPFAQAIGQQHTVRRKVFYDIGAFHTYAVALPHVNTRLNDLTFDDFRLWSRYNTNNKGLKSIEDFINRIFDRDIEMEQLKGRGYKMLSNGEISYAVKKLNCVLDYDTNPFVSIDETEKWLKVQNLETYKALQKNKRIIIEGPPGSGKTTYAKAYIDQNKDKKGLYLCWNNLLLASIKHELKQREISLNTDFKTVFSFVLENTNISYEELKEKDEIAFCNYVLNNLKVFSDIEKYDYLIVDELQDYVDKGADIIIEKILKGGICNGLILALYDIDQSFSWSGRDITDDIEFIAEYCAHIKLDEIKRSNQSPDIQGLVKGIGENGTNLMENIDNISSDNIKIRNGNFENCLDSFCEDYLSKIRDPASSLSGKDCTILIETELFQKYKHEFIMLGTRELTKETITQASSDVGYVKIPTFKGLESDNVFLFITEPNNYNMYEWYLGASRAMKNLVIFLIK